MKTRTEIAADLRAESARLRRLATVYTQGGHLENLELIQIADRLDEAAAQWEKPEAAD